MECHTTAFDPTGIHWQQLRGNPRDTSPWISLVRIYRQAGLPWHASYAARQLQRIQADLVVGDPALGVALEQQADLAAHALLGRSRRPDGRPDPGVEAMASRLLDWQPQNPGDWLSWLYLARLVEVIGPDPVRSWPPAAEALLRACDLEPLAGESLHWLGVWRLNGSDPAGAVQALSPLVQVRPQRFGSMLFLGEALLRTGQQAAAEAAFTRASQSQNGVFLRELAQRVLHHNYWQEAIEILGKALTLDPDSIPALLELSNIHWEVYQLSEAEAICQRILALDPCNRDVVSMMSALPGRKGDAKAHFKNLKVQFESLRDPSSRLVSSLAMASLYQDDLSALDVARLHRQLCEGIEAAIEPLAAAKPTASGNHRIRLGLVSSDFHRQHPVNIFMLPILQVLDHERFELFIYNTGSMHDDYTLMAQACADHWLEASKLDDQALAQQIGRDGIQLLMDLSGHTSKHRLGVFCMRAAPVQVTFLGYPHSTGLSRMDWLIGDRWVSPEQHHHLFSEAIAQLPHSVFCWAPVDPYPLPAPRPDGAEVVFGSFNNVMKLSPRTLDLWARILAEVPHSRLLLKAPSLRDRSVVERFRHQFMARSIDPDRLEFQGPTELGLMMQSYGEIDIALDPFPYNGGTTSLQALWMGVPLISLMGDNFVARMGGSFLHSLGRPEWLADDEVSYLGIAQTLADSVVELRRSRSCLRSQMAASPLCDLSQYASDFQALLTRIWSQHQSGSSSRFLAGGDG